ncbi:Extensin-like protein C-terminus [Sphingomonas sp. YR710]|uniref:extensin-like domain-containing protein n=1 Tax=Sphingomonas sp. YR710 TaxID=1882773 RepID=UPI00088679BA|nr:extensin family protein [Sphingomonas sp. YR710]SDD71733.1 Extensin-like protein C-terminus [Sphingomonas sp. YR710]
MRRAALAVLISSIALAGCVGPSKTAHRPRPHYVPPAETPERLRACLATLGAEGSRYESLPDRQFPGGCSATSSVKLVAIGIPVTNLGALKCGLAVPFARWVRQDVRSAAARWLGTDVTKIESFGTFACRPKNGQAGNELSEHGRANAVDIGAFVLRNGRRITVKDGWNGDDERVRNFLRALHSAACARFSVVLGPDANAFHADHLHFDMGMGPYCK